LKYVNITGAVALALVLLGQGGVCAAAEDNLYRWTDEQGNQVNSDVPPPAGVEYEVLSTSSSMVRSVETGEEKAARSEQAAGSGPGKPSEPKVYEDDRRITIEKNPEYCAQARDNLAQLDTRARIRMRDDQGEVRYLDEDERALEREKAIAAIEAYCE
jgi:hypothetical protein